MKMSKNVKVDFTSKMITVTKSFLKRAETPFSDEFQLLVALQKELPNFKLAVEKNSRLNRLVQQKLK